MTSPIRTARALAGASHPGPTLAITTITVLLGVASGLEIWRIIVLGLAMATGQVSVGLSNDWIDADRDRAVGRRDKPVARGDIPAAIARNAAFVSLTLAIVLTIPLGGWALACHVIFICCAWAYNAGIKGTALSVAPYLLAFGLLPALVTLARPEPHLPPGWIVAAAALLGAGAHFANVLPDLGDDAATGVRGLPHRFGGRVSLVVTWIAFVGAGVCLALAIGIPTPLGAVALILSLAIGAIGIAVGSRGVGRATFALLIAGALVDVVLLLVAGSRILG
ncbi:MAG TPA: UbiA family prenyltransferase [Pseudolysinimonas sp.]|nr:UbiA family prenyltransferase [Pseudolysinimonas sp.]